MKKSLIALGIFLTLAAVMIVHLTYSTNVTLINYQEDILKFDKSSENVLSAHTIKIQEMAQVPNMYKDGLKEIVRETMSGRYGEDGSKAVMQWIQEQNLQFDSSMYVNLQAIMAAGRDEFRLSQDRKLDACANYKRYSRNPITRVIASSWEEMLYSDWPENTACELVSDNSTREAFRTRTTEAVKIN